MLHLVFDNQYLQLDVMVFNKIWWTKFFRHNQLPKFSGVNMQYPKAWHCCKVCYRNNWKIKNWCPRRIQQKINCHQRKNVPIKIISAIFNKHHRISSCCTTLIYTDDTNCMVMGQDLSVKNSWIFKCNLNSIVSLDFACVFVI